MNAAPATGPSRTLAFEIIRALGPLSRTELAQASGLTEATVSTAVRRLIDAGLVFEAGQRKSTGGKPQTLLEVQPRACTAIGVGLGSARIDVELVDLTGAVLAVRALPGVSSDESPVAAVARVAAAVTEVRAQAAQTHGAAAVDTLAGIGVGAPGPLDATAGVLHARRPSAKWRGFALADALAAATGLPVAVDNDATCVALGESWWRRAQWPPPAVSATVYMADGIGSGIMIGGRVFRGSSSNAGEVGHVTVDIDGPRCSCGAHGCVEVYATPAAVVARAAADPAVTAQVPLGPGIRSGVREAFLALGVAADAGVPAARELMTDAGRRLGVGLLALCNVLDLEEVTLAGSAIVDAGSVYRAAAVAHLHDTAFARPMHAVRVRLTDRTDAGVARGAAALALERAVTGQTA